MTHVNKQKCLNEAEAVSSGGGYTSLDLDSNMLPSDDYKDFWNEYKIVQETRNQHIDDEDHVKQEIDEVENDAELLRAMGMEHLAEAFRQCREINNAELDVSLRQLSKQQADTVKRRVRALNNTVRNRFGIAGRQPRGWQRKPDIRNVFRDVETSSTGTRSRSATPDSLDSIEKLGDADTEPPCPPSPPSLLTSPWPSSNWTQEQPSPPRSLLGSVPSFVKIFNQPDSADGAPSSLFGTEKESKETLRRTPSAPPSCHRGIASSNETDIPIPNVLPPNEMFRRAVPWNSHRVDVASNTEGIELLGFSRIGTILKPRHSRERSRTHRDGSIGSGSLVNLAHPETIAPEGAQSLVELPNHVIDDFQPSSVPISFELHFNSRKSSKQSDSTVVIDDRVSVDNVTDLDFKDMTPILWLELCTVFDKYSLKVERRKPAKRKRKEDGNLFGVNLSTLVMRDYRLVGDTNATPVPLVIQDMLGRLSGPRSREEGLLRIAGNKQRVESVCNEIEAHFYSKHDLVKNLLDQLTSHELVSILKRLLRDLPQPLLTVELIHLFYECHGIKEEHDQLHALNLLVLLLPVENRSTLYSFLSFLGEVVNNEQYNKMNLHNVAMIIAPSLFPPRYFYMPRPNKVDINSQVVMAANCCKVVEEMIQSLATLQTIPGALLKQARRYSQDQIGCRRNKEEKQVFAKMFNLTTRLKRSFRSRGDRKNE